LLILFLTGTTLNVMSLMGVVMMVGIVVSNSICVGVATNGAVRDLPALEKIGFHAYSARLAVSHAYSHIVEIGTPVELGGLKISPGDLLHGDQHGILSIPKEIAAKIPEAVLSARRREEELFEICRRPELKIEEIRRVIRELRGAAR